MGEGKDGCELVSSSCCVSPVSGVVTPTRARARGQGQRPLQPRPLALIVLLPGHPRHRLIYYFLWV